MLVSRLDRQYIRDMCIAYNIAYSYKKQKVNNRYRNVINVTPELIMELLEYNMNNTRYYGHLKPKIDRLNKILKDIK